MLKRLLRFCRDQDGSTAVEFAIVANFFLVLMVGLFAAGYYFVVQSDLEHSISAAERYALVHKETNAEIVAVVRTSLGTYDGSALEIDEPTRATRGGITFVKMVIKYKLDVGASLGIKPLTITAVRIFPT